MERVFQLAAVILLGVGAWFFWHANNDYAFIAGVLGCVAFFLSVRTQAKARNVIRDAERRNELEAEETADD